MKRERWINYMNMASMVMQKYLEVREKVLKIEDAIALPCATPDKPCSGLFFNIQLNKYECIRGAELEYVGNSLTCLNYST